MPSCGFVCVLYASVETGCFLWGCCFVPLIIFWMRDSGFAFVRRCRTDSPRETSSYPLVCRRDETTAQCAFLGTVSAPLFCFGRNALRLWCSYLFAWRRRSCGVEWQGSDDAVYLWNCASSRAHLVANLRLRSELHGMAAVSASKSPNSRAKQGLFHTLQSALSEPSSFVLLAGYSLEDQSLPSGRFLVTIAPFPLHRIL
ncbi:hypothetical protein B0H19DRAFT_1159468 [Mycena capillaripes]|nr:hypothetical protein B0H19DRAFT_1159468 [Mycena capillaripes]